MVNLDTHILIFAFNGELQASEQRLLESNRWSISSVVFWEMAKLVQLGRIDIDLDNRNLVRLLNRLQVWPLDLDIARASTRLDFRSDPADEIIAATSVVHDVPLITRDTTMRSSRIVPLAI